MTTLVEDDPILFGETFTISEGKSIGTHLNDLKLSKSSKRPRRTMRRSSRLPRGGGAIRR